MPESANIARHLPLMAARQPDHPAVKIPRGRTSDGRINYLVLTFRQLDAEADAWSAHLSARGVRRGDRVLVELIDGLAVRSPLALIGLAYVLEEGKNGGRQIAKRARLKYRLRAGHGVAYLDPYGEAQRQRWLDFKADMEAALFEPEEIAVIADAACLMYRSLIAVMDEILALERISRRCA